MGALGSIPTLPLTPQSLAFQPTMSMFQHQGGEALGTNASSLLAQALSSQHTRVATHTLTPIPPPPPKVDMAPQQAAQAASLTLEGLFDQANQLTSENKNLIVNFLSGNRNNPNPDQGPVRQILLNLEDRFNNENMPFTEQLIFEINYDTGTWRKIRRRRRLTEQKAPEQKTSEQTQEPPSV